MNFILFLHVFFKDRVFLYIHICPKILFVDQANIVLRDLSHFESLLLGLKAYVIMARKIMDFRREPITINLIHGYISYLTIKHIPVPQISVAFTFCPRTFSLLQTETIIENQKCL